MAKITLSEEQKRWWERLLVIYALQPQQDLYYLQLSLRQLAVEILRKEAAKDRIIVAAQTVMKFNNAAEKERFIARLSRPGEFTDDAVLTKLLYALGFQPVIHIPIAGEKEPFRMLPFEQKTGDSLRIDLVNNAYTGSRTTDDPDSYRYKTGSHWSLKGHSTPGRENSCAFYAVAQRIQEIGLKKIPVALPKAATTTPKASTPKVVAKESQTRATIIAEREKITQHAEDSSVVMTKTLGAIPVLPENKTVREIEQEFKARELKDNERYEFARQKMEKLSTSDLIQIYHYALTLTGGDTYLKDRPRVAKEEMGSDLVEKAIKTGSYPADFSFLVKEELVHMLAKESWRNPKAYDELMKSNLTERLVKQPLKTCSKEAKEATPAAYRTPTLVR